MATTMPIHEGEILIYRPDVSGELNGKKWILASYKVPQEYLAPNIERASVELYLSNNSTHIKRLNEGARYVVEKDGSVKYIPIALQFETLRQGEVMERTGLTLRIERMNREVTVNVLGGQYKSMEVIGDNNLYGHAAIREDVDAKITARDSNWFFGLLEHPMRKAHKLFSILALPILKLKYAGRTAGYAARDLTHNLSDANSPVPSGDGPTLCRLVAKLGQHVVIEPVRSDSLLRELLLIFPDAK